MSQISPQASIDPQAQIADDVVIGPGTSIGADVTIGAGSVIGPNVVIQGPTTLGRNNRVHPFASLGGAPQDLTYRGEPTRLEIGDNNTIFEFVTFNRGTLKQDGVTRIGSHNFIMAYVHIAHDCQVGSHTVLANNTTLAGHVVVEDYVVCGGMTAVHQFCRLGAYCYTGHGGAVVRDVPPYVMINDYPQRPRGVNKVGLERQGFSAQRIRRIREAYRILYRSDLNLEEARARLVEYGQGDPDIQRTIDFLDLSARSILR